MPDRFPSPPTAPLPPVTGLIPHDGPAVLLRTVESFNERELTATAVIDAGSGFQEPDGSLPGWAGPELMAQAVSALGTLQNGQPPAIGLLLGVREYHSRVDRLRTGTLVVIHVRESSSDDQGRGVFRCRLTVAGTVVAECILTAWRPCDLREVLEGQLA